MDLPRNISQRSQSQREAVIKILAEDGLLYVTWRKKYEENQRDGTHR